MSLTVFALLRSLNEGVMSLAIEQYGTCVTVEQVFHNKYIIIMYAVNPPTLTPHSLTGKNTRNMHKNKDIPPKNI